MALIWAEILEGYYRERYQGISPERRGAQPQDPNEDESAWMQLFPSLRRPGRR
jgi:hypothetical protein